MIFLLQTSQTPQDFCPFPIAAPSEAKKQNLIIYERLVHDKKHSNAPNFALSHYF